MIARLFEEHLKNKGFSRQTLRKYISNVNYFLLWLGRSMDKTDVRDVTAPDIIEYQKHLSERGDRKELTATTRKGMIGVVRQLFRFLSRNEYLLFNPMDPVDSTVKCERKLRESIPENEMKEFLDRIDENEIHGLRDRALFELMYGTGLRVSEITNLNVTDVDLNTGMLLVREGKGKKDRIVPLGQNTRDWLFAYLVKARGSYLGRVTRAENREAFFLSENGSRLTAKMINYRLKKRFESAGLSTRVSCHMIRHSFATHILEHGAGVKHVKEILGHTCMESTVGYTHFSVKSLKRIVKMYHPRENELFTELTGRDELMRILREGK